ncbi:hypothetical protein SDC9_164804 [bioreactor metagenome]|uniref:Uncharacterized protein n=1 Tax=bioreactor metagenome TaxID=1076179 RepID=A0A645FSM8_9ZZZZ
MIYMGMGYQKGRDLLRIKWKFPIGHVLFIRALAHAAIDKNIAFIKLNQVTGARDCLGRSAKFDLHEKCSLLEFFIHYTIYFYTKGDF